MYIDIAIMKMLNFKLINLLYNFELGLQIENVTSNFHRNEIPLPLERSLFRLLIKEEEIVNRIKNGGFKIIICMQVDKIVF